MPVWMLKKHTQSKRMWPIQLKHCSHNALCHLSMTVLKDWFLNFKGDHSSLTKMALRILLRASSELKCVYAVPFMSSLVTCWSSSVSAKNCQLALLRLPRLLRVQFILIAAISPYFPLQGMNKKVQSLPSASVTTPLKILQVDAIEHLFATEDFKFIAKVHWMSLRLSNL